MLIYVLNIKLTYIAVFRRFPANESFHQILCVSFSLIQSAVNLTLPHLLTLTYTVRIAIQLSLFMRVPDLPCVDITVFQSKRKFIRLLITSWRLYIEDLYRKTQLMDFQVLHSLFCFRVKRR